jgi:hypothetical protein
MVSLHGSKVSLHASMVNLHGSMVSLYGSMVISDFMMFVLFTVYNQKKTFNEEKFGTGTYVPLR